MPVEPRPEVASIPLVPHGGRGAEEPAACGPPSGDVLDFSVNTSPLGPPPSVAEALRSLDVARYPDPTALALRTALAERLGLDAAQLVVGNGSSELIWLLALAYARPAPATVLIVAPTFGEYERACRLLGATVTHEVATPERQFRPDVAGLAARIRRERPRLVWLCNPNNPTGHYAGRPAVGALLEACVSAGALLVVDEAYLAFVDRPDSLLDLLPSGHLFLLRSLTKDYALAGLRLGFGAGTREMADALRRVQPPWSVNAAAQAAGIAALADHASLERMRREVQAARAALVAGLERLGFAVTPPAANFVLVEVGDAAAMRRSLLARGYLVRDCASFGLPRHIRIAVRRRAECARLLAAMEELATR
jgi:L-threonine-O-3-phosphate decarboxylase